jgi:hypothetical protein
MATYNATKSTAGFVEAGKGVFGGIATITNNLNTDVNTPLADRQGLKLGIYHMTDVANTDTWASGIPAAYACAWQPEDATDDDARAVITAYTAVGERSRGGSVFTFVTGGTRAGWLWVLHGT